MATTRATSYVVTAAVWNAVLSRLTDDGITFSGNVNGGSIAGTTGSLSSTLAVTGAATFASTITERGRSTPMGEWNAVSFSAGNFTSNPSGKWDVDSGDVLLNRYSMVGKTMTWTVRVTATSVTDTTATELRIAIPGGFSGAQASFTRTGFFQEATAALDDTFVAVSTTYVYVSRVLGGVFANTTNGTAFGFTISFEVS